MPQDEKANAVISTSASSLSSPHVIQLPLRLLRPCRFPLQRLFAFLAVVSIIGVQLTSRTPTGFYLFSSVPRLSPCRLPRPLPPHPFLLHLLLSILFFFSVSSGLRFFAFVKASSPAFFALFMTRFFVLLLSSASLPLSSSSFFSSSSAAPLRPLGPLRPPPPPLRLSSPPSSSSSSLRPLLRPTPFAPKIAVTSFLATWTS